MTKDWKLIAQGRGVPIAPEELPRLSALDAVFRPLIATLPLEVEPAVILSEEAVDPL